MGSSGQLKTLTSIVAIDRHGAIGIQNALPWRLKNDLSFFKETTISNTVIMGRKTYESIGGFLPKRKNVVLTHNFDLFQGADDCRVALSLSEALYRAETDSSAEIFVVGGAQTYLLFAPLIDRYLVTLVDHVVPSADAFLDKSIMDDFRNWNHSEKASFPATPGIDEFPFRVLEVRPPDTNDRRIQRSNMFAEFGNQIRSRSGNSLRRKAAGNGHQQLSLI